MTQANSKNKQTVLFMTDLHLPYFDKKAYDVMIKYVTKNHTIDKIVIGGDLIDFFKISRFSKDPNEKKPLYKEIDFTIKFLENFRKIFPNQQIILLKGNHEQRFEKYINNQAPELSKIKGASVEEQLELDRFNIKMIDNIQRLTDGKKPFSIGKLYYLHGHEIPGAGINCSRSKFLKVQHNIIFGHHHTVQQYTHKQFNEIQSSWACGCLCSVNPEYCPINQHIQGFALVHYDSSGFFRLQNKMIIDGRII